MRKLIIGLAALLATMGAAPKITFQASTATLSLVTSAEAAPRGNPFCKAAGSPARLAALVERSLVADPTGDTPLDPAACHERRPATPRDFLKAFNESGAHLASVQAVPAYVHSLVKVIVRGRYRSACLAYRFAAGKLEWYPLVNCVTRSLHRREVMWGDPVSRRPMLLSNCANPVQGPAVRTGCVDVLIPVKKGDQVRIHDTGPTDIARDACTSLLRAGETEWESPFVERCPDEECTFTYADEATDAPAWGTGSWTARKDGYAIVRLPEKVATQLYPVTDVRAADYRLWICVRHANGVQSCGLGVRWLDYIPRYGSRVAAWLRVNDVSGSRIPEGDRRVAVIYPDEAAWMTAGSPKTRIGTPSVLWFDWNCPW